MPYRGAGHLGPSCYRHAAAPAAHQCARCAQPVCEICILFLRTRGLCPPCAGRARRLGRMRAGALVSLGGAAALAMIAAIGFVVTHGQSRHVGKEQPKIAALLDELSRAPCDRARSVELGEALLRAGEFRNALKHNDEFFKQCGPHARLLWVSYNAHRYLGEYAAAVDIASELIERNPGDPDFRWWRALAYEGLGDLASAADDYREALRLEPRLDRIPFNLVDVLERLGSPCDGAPVLERYLALHPDSSRSPIILGRVDHLRQQGCAVGGDPAARIYP
jgi:tetratricopeptide (TPR) repeat protein